MGPERTQEFAYKLPDDPERIDDGFEAVQSAVATARRKRLMELDYENLLAKNFEEFLVNFKQFPGE